MRAIAGVQVEVAGARAPVCPSMATPLIGDQPEDIETHVPKMVLEYISNPKCIILLPIQI